MEKYGRNHLLFLHDFSVPFDDNISDHDHNRNPEKTKYGND